MLFHFLTHHTTAGICNMNQYFNSIVCITFSLYNIRPENLNNATTPHINSRRSWVQLENPQEKHLSIFSLTRTPPSSSDNTHYLLVNKILFCPRYNSATTLQYYIIYQPLHIAHPLMRHECNIIVNS